MNKNELLQQWRKEEQMPFQGWDFSYIDGRMIQDNTPGPIWIAPEPC